MNPKESCRAALAYAIWDAENTVKMKAECINEHLERADSVIHWLGVHGHTIVPNEPSDAAVEALRKIEEGFGPNHGSHYCLTVAREALAKAKVTE